MEELRLEIVKHDAKNDPKVLIAEMSGFDPTEQEYFSFTMFPPGEDPYWPYEKPRGYWPHPEGDGWLWQAEVVDWWMDPVIRKFLILKARQLGITWLAVAVGLWYMLYRPGSSIVAYSYEEEQAKKLVQRAWLMFQSLPMALRGHVEIITPDKAVLPSEWIRVVDKATGKMSSFQALPATQRAGHGDTVTWAIMDEIARQTYAKDIYTAINPATSRGGRLAMISTANGVSNAETGEGNFFHHLYDTRDEKGLGFLFLPWHKHPERGDHGADGKRPIILGPGRDPEWYQREAMALSEVERNQQYPLNEVDAFMLSGSLYFDREALEFYRGHLARPLVRGQYVTSSTRSAKFMQLANGMIELYEKPREDAKYAIGADSATGKGADFSSAHVIDLETGQIVARLRCKLEIPKYADQLYWLGRAYNTALIVPERQGGYGEALIISLRDGTTGRPPYPKLYRHLERTRGKRPMQDEYGYPMTTKTRPECLEYLKSLVHDRLFQKLPSGTVSELGTFVYMDTNPSPRAQEGCHDDDVMSLALAAQAWRQGGHHPAPKGKRVGGKKQAYKPHPSRQTI